MVAGVQPVVRWQLSQEAVVEICLAVLPEALLPLWQVAQLPTVTVLWLNVAGSQAVVRWQLSHEAVVGKCDAVFPVALLPLWHVAQEPGVTPVWFMVAPPNELKFL